MVPSAIYCTSCGAANQTQDAFCFTCGRPLRATPPLLQTGLLPLNQLLKQRYRILSNIGQGGFGAVYKAEDTLFHNRLVAVKEMSQNGLSQQEIVEAVDAFKREAHLLASLDHHSLPKIYDYFTDAGRWYLVMEFIEGETLEEYVTNKGGTLPLQEVLAIGMQLCTVLDYLHTRQPPIIFRDLKPLNIMRTRAGHIYLIDFGIARLFQPGKVKDTHIVGSPGYAAPEQYGKAQTTPRSDIYSLGATLHRLLTGNDPASNTPTLFDFPPLHLRGQITPAGLEILMGQMVEKVASQRPASMAVVKQELQRIAAPVPPKQTPLPQQVSPNQPTIPAKPAAQPQSPPAPQQPKVLPSPGRAVVPPVPAMLSARRSNSNLAWIFSIVGILLLIIGIVVWSESMAGSSTSGNSQSSTNVQVTETSNSQSSTNEVTETVNPPFVNGPNGASTTNSYIGNVTIEVSGYGQAAGPQYSDAFYIFTDDSGNSITPLHPDDFHFSLCINNQSVNTYVPQTPPYSSDHTYQFTISVGSSPQQITFGICDTYTSDNSGSFNIKVSGTSAQP